MSEENGTPPKRKNRSMVDKLLVRLPPELKKLIGKEADRLSIEGGMGEMCVQILAEYFKRPDLSKVPRKRLGRPRKRVRIEEAPPL